MDDLEVHVDLEGTTRLVGTLRLHVRHGGQTASFEYSGQWLESAERFALEPALPLFRGAFPPSVGRALFDSAPDTWGRRLMQRAERRRAQNEGRMVRTLTDFDYLLGASDRTRLGALRFRRVGGSDMQATDGNGVPSLVELGRLLHATERILRDEESDEDLRLIFAPGSSLGGARPKASVIDSHGNLSIAKFPKEDDDYSLERWEHITLTLASKAGIRTAEHNLITVQDRPVLLSRRFDRSDTVRIPFLSALSLMGLSDGERGSYPEIADALAQHGARAAADASELYRRMTFNVLVSNVDDHLRNHGFLRHGTAGWTLSPAYDLNPVPAEIRPRILTTSIDVDDATCNLDLVLSVAHYFGLTNPEARRIVCEVAAATSTWREAAVAVGAPASEIERMSSAFEHDDRARARTLSQR